MKNKVRPSRPIIQKHDQDTGRSGRKQCTDGLPIDAVSVPIKTGARCAVKIRNTYLASFNKVIVNDQNAVHRPNQCSQKIDREVNNLRRTEQIQGRISTETIEASMPPLRQEMYFGKILEISKAAETKFATILTPTVATSIVSPKRRTAALLSSLPMTAIGSTINSPKTARVPEIVTTEIKEKKEN